MNSLDQIADEFINHLLVEKGLARNTVAAYSRDLLLYLDHVRAQGISDIAQTDTALVIEHLRPPRCFRLG